MSQWNEKSTTKIVKVKGDKFLGTNKMKISYKFSGAEGVQMIPLPLKIILSVFHSSGYAYFSTRFKKYYVR